MAINICHILFLYKNEYRKKTIAGLNVICDFGCCFQLAKDLLHPSLEEEKRTCKLKRLVQSPNSYFMDVKCPGNLLMCTGAFHVVIEIIIKVAHYTQK